MTALPAFLACPPGLEPLLDDEVREVFPGRVTTQEPGGVAADLTRDDLVRACLWLRIPSRVVVRVGSFRACNFRQLVREVARCDVTAYLNPGRAVDVETTTRHCRLYHTGAIGERVASALGVVQLDQHAPRPDATLLEPTLRLMLRGISDQFTLSVDATGELLHRRGTKAAITRAPLRETLAASLLRFAGYRGEQPLIDPMCGSGTLLLEAASIAINRAPGLTRRFALESWPSHDAALLAKLRADAATSIRPHLLHPIVGFDRDPHAVRAARENLASLGVQGVEVSQADLHSLELAGVYHKALVATNPPYGVRIGRGADLTGLYRRLGDVTRSLDSGALALVTSDSKLANATGLRLTPGPITPSGGLRVRFYTSAASGASRASASRRKSTRG